METVSIIIPVYNVEKYLDRCIDSVLKQSYQNIEVLLVDDGSTDKSGLLCDRWAEKDSRIRVIHKVNEGVSVARNTGLDQANGDYIAFVDSDDFIDANMIETLYNTLQIKHAEMSICSFVFVDETGTPLEEENQSSPIKDEILTGYEVIQKLAGDRGWYFHLAWNKIYKRSLFSDIRFPVNKFAEDAFIAHRLLGKCTTVACIHDACYYYTQRADSLVHNRTWKTCLNDAESFLDRACYCYEHGLYECASHFYWETTKQFFILCSETVSDPELSAELQETFRWYRGKLKISKKLRLKRRLQTALFALSPSLYLFYRKVKRSFLTFLSLVSNQE